MNDFTIDQTHKAVSNGIELRIVGPLDAGFETQLARCSAHTY